MKSSKGEILYIQFTNPGAYPPLEHSSDIFLDRGFKTTFLGIQSRGQSRSLRFQERDGRVVRLLPWVDSGICQKLQFARYFIWTSIVAVVRRPRLVYCSDHLSTPVALVLSLLGQSVVYHEHDAPGHPRSVFDRALAWSRRAVLRRVPVIVPGEGRRELVEAEGARDVQVVWNCPSVTEVKHTQKREGESGAGVLKIVYQGGIGDDGRIPANLIRALASAELRGRAQLKIIGYETDPSGHFVDALAELAADHGFPDAIEFLGPLSRSAMLETGAAFDVGLSLLPMKTENFNLSTLIGPSNKPFDYMAQGLPMLCSALDDWRAAFSDYAVFCDPRSVESISEAVLDLLVRRQHWLQVGRNGQQKILTCWNYETLFAQVRHPRAGLR